MAAVRLATFSLSRMCSTCLSTVRLLIMRISAMAALVAPREIHCVISVSRGVSGSWGWCGWYWCDILSWAINATGSIFFLELLFSIISSLSLLHT